MAAVAGGVQVDPWLVGMFTGAGIVGLECGSRFGRRLPEQIVQRGFAVVLVLVALALLIIPFLAGGAP